LPSTQAFMASGIGKSGLVFTPGPEYMVASSRRILSSAAALIMNFGVGRNRPFYDYTGTAVAS
jgi:hypothetical protein